MATTWQLSVDQLASRSPGAVQLLRLASFLAPEGIPLALLASRPRRLPEELAEVGPILGRVPNSEQATAEAARCRLLATRHLLVRHGRSAPVA